MLSVLMDYYECADKGYGKQGFDKVERKRFPHLKEEERIMPTMEFGLDRAKQQGVRQGLRKGKQLGIEQGIEQGREQGMQQGMRRGKQLGIEQGIEKERQDAANRMLTRGMPEEQIQDVLQLTAEQLDNIKRKLEQN